MPIVIELGCAQRDAVVRATVAVHEHEGVGFRVGDAVLVVAMIQTN